MTDRELAYATLQAYVRDGEPEKADAIVAIATEMALKMNLKVWEALVILMKIGQLTSKHGVVKK